MRKDLTVISAGVSVLGVLIALLSFWHGHRLDVLEERVAQIEDALTATSCAYQRGTNAYLLPFADFDDIAGRIQQIGCQRMIPVVAANEIPDCFDHVYGEMPNEIRLDKTYGGTPWIGVALPPRADGEAGFALAIFSGRVDADGTVVCLQ